MHKLTSLFVVDVELMVGVAVDATDAVTVVV